MSIFSELGSEAFWSGEVEECEHLLKGALTIHDHWLSEKEAKEHWMSFAYFKGNGSGEKWSEFVAKEASFVELFRKLEEECGLQVWEYGQRVAGSSRQSVGVTAACVDNVREKCVDLFKAQKCGVAILGGFDLTFPAYCQSDQAWSSLSASARSVGLYLLPRNG